MASVAPCPTTLKTKSQGNDVEIVEAIVVPDVTVPSNGNPACVSNSAVVFAPDTPNAKIATFVLKLNHAVIVPTNVLAALTVAYHSDITAGVLIVPIFLSTKVNPVAVTELAEIVAARQREHHDNVAA